ncbi:TNFAIP3-interacting protein 1 isoform X1 [Synchiropus splendidus]|uniref:TNFAIP3-interacting protein 1 isoform X1 n=1 Tax=Synchiropus splendidus TaxID=270530 RepID=UPI00237DF00F|nr:TNFAIP3-interacting protein 1 isoform X1 [Synchiropus splendidus]XP_053734968.1 TNFAIP3-interacting protein 1 isoform X1 [Synchiropus splendidus]XP_053734969.1 TNFAIP3-interacting protein 1 isoform X1 [Synchiropus splendidus]
MAMEGKGPYRIYDPGGTDVKTRDEMAGGTSYRQLLEENGLLRERMKGLKSLGDLLEESQSEASRLRQRVEELVRDNEALKSSSFAASLCAAGACQSEMQSRLCLHPAAEQKEEQMSCLGKTLQPEKPNEALNELEVGNSQGKTSDALTARSVVIPLLPQENNELASQLKKLESSFSIFAEESNPNQLLAHLGRMAVEFHHLSSKVQKNEQRTSLLQTLCEQLRQENNELRKKMEEDHHIRNRDLEQLRQENQKLKELVTGGAATVTASAAASDSETTDTKEEPVKEESAAVRPKMDVTTPQKSGKASEKTPTKHCDPEVYEKKIKLLEKQRKDVLEVNKQWDIQWNSMKTQFEQKITDLRQRLAESQKTVLELEAEREQRQRDYDKKLLLAKSKIENVQGEKECLNSETTELKQKIRYLQDQLLPLSKQREYQEKEIQRLNRALEEALNLQSTSSSQQPPGQANFTEAAHNLKKQELLTQIAVLKEQVKIFEEDFRKERSDRERMNEEKEDLRRQVERLQGQITNLTNQLHQAQNECQRERTERCKLERLQMQHHKQGQQQERRTSDPTSGSVNGPLSPPYCGPFVQVGQQGLEGWPVHFPPRMPNAAAAAAPPPVRDFQPINPGFPWQSSFPQPRGARAVGESSRPPPENADQSSSAAAAAAATSAGFGKRERQNIDPGKH